MEYREPPRIAATERRLDGVVDDAEIRPRLRRFEFVRAQRHLDFPRLAVAVLVAMATVAVVGYGLFQVSTSAVTWLHHQPQFQLRFLDIQLKPPPPDWFRGGTEAFLKQVRANARESEVLEIMDLPRGSLDKDQIAIDFKKDPWVEDVPRVEYPPYSIAVHLVYRTPVAWIHAPPAPPVYLDRDGTTLPIEDVDRDKLGPLLPVIGRGLDQASAANEPGLPWRSSAPGADAARLKRCVEDAATLAGFLLESERARESSTTAALRMVRIVTADHRGLWLVNSENAMILWGDAPGKESNGSLKAVEKWEILGRWAKSMVQRSLPSGDYWEFSKSELIATETDHKRK
jgi:hypothetical protein